MNRSVFELVQGLNDWARPVHLSPLMTVRLSIAQIHTSWQQNLIPAMHTRVRASFHWQTNGSSLIPLRRLLWLHQRQQSCLWSASVLQFYMREEMSDSWGKRRGGALFHSSASWKITDGEYTYNGWRVRRNGDWMKLFTPYCAPRNEKLLQWCTLNKRFIRSLAMQV